jgi:acetyl esterase/lipase
VRFLGALPLLAAALLALPATAFAGAEVDMQDGVRYGQAGRTVLRLDVYRSGKTPKANAPLIIWVHGGGFTSGGRADLFQYAQDFAERGYLSAAVDYRLSGKAVDAQHDTQAAVRFFRKRAKDFGIDQRKIVVAGYSAGAQAALRVAFRSEDAGSSGNAGVSSKVAGAIAMAGSESAEKMDKKDPPILMLHGTKDRDVPYSDGQATCRAAESRGGGCKLVTFKGADHGLPFTKFKQVAKAIADWKPSRLQARSR